MKREVAAGSGKSGIKSGSEPNGSDELPEQGIFAEYVRFKTGRQKNEYDGNTPAFS